MIPSDSTEIVDIISDHGAVQIEVMKQEAAT
jgi:hypothetical protein